MWTRTFAKGIVCLAWSCGVMAIAAAAEPPVQAEASLVRAMPAATNTEIDGVNWYCKGDKCVGMAKRPPPDTNVRACRKVAAALGQLTAFSSRGRELSKEDLQNCNRAAR
jgi:hypothetical protein